jgi:hypothetical protein
MVEENQTTTPISINLKNVVNLRNITYSQNNVCVFKNYEEVRLEACPAPGSDVRFPMQFFQLNSSEIFRMYITHPRLQRSCVQFFLSCHYY